MPLIDPRQMMLEREDMLDALRRRARAARAKPAEIVTGRHLLYVRTEGPPLGTFDGFAIWPIAIDHQGQRYGFIGLAPRLASGAYNINALAPGEWIIEPGLLYRRCDADHRAS
jgi:hypothetical protein